MNENVQKFLDSLEGMKAAKADFQRIQQECEQKINEAREAYKQAAEAHAENGGSFSYDTGSGQVSMCVPLPDYMVEYYAAQKGGKV
jgi:hypothetical protein